MQALEKKNMQMHQVPGPSDNAPKKHKNIKKL